MSESIHKTLLIKHVTSRMLLDSRVRGNTFNLSACEKGWQLVVEDVDAGVMQTIQEELANLNLFYFEELEEAQGRSIRKWWLYDTVLPELVTDETARQLTLIVNTRTGYSNEHVSKQ
ncbi:hypothetical protein SAMN03159341_103501 [Paenibacillus sp. 1_12]|uniref:hypothetical protein n=1 Tax=Paenibacillus sp. 1_12 TaxID=1566278 RepID=UPI0008ED0D2E|nr:hypothetical protein [Paenibacillus sp. 1_12]SFL15223.1 hypothetical protein SAMN03159341_103501 [Paenibacillus sp. 1_12]